MKTKNVDARVWGDECRDQKPETFSRGPDRKENLLPLKTTK